MWLSGLGSALVWIAACADPEVSTLVRYQNGKPIASWTVDTARGQCALRGDGVCVIDHSDAGPDAEDAATDRAAARIDDDDDAGAPAQLASTCRFRVTTRAQGGRYAPRNIGAIWIARDDGSWVKTLKVWAGVRLRYLTRYLQANAQRDTTDAVTSATLRQHATHELTWDLRDAGGNMVPDGHFQMRVEVTDRSGEGQLLSIPFTQSNRALSVSPEDSAFFADVELRCGAGS